MRGERGRLRFAQQHLLVTRGEVHLEAAERLGDLADLFPLTLVLLAIPKRENGAAGKRAT